MLVVSFEREVIVANSTPPFFSWVANLSKKNCSYSFELLVLVIFKSLQEKSELIGIFGASLQKIL